MDSRPARAGPGTGSRRRETWHARPAGVNSMNLSMNLSMTPSADPPAMRPAGDLW